MQEAFRLRRADWRNKCFEGHPSLDCPLKRVKQTKQHAEKPYRMQKTKSWKSVEKKILAQKNPTAATKKNIS